MTRKLGWGAVFLGFVGCGGDSLEGSRVPLPNTFESVFVHGQVCIPESVNTNSQTRFPVRFVYRLPDCVEFTPKSAAAQLIIVGDELVLLGTAQLNAGQELPPGCTESELKWPAEADSYEVTVDFLMDVPVHESGSPLFGGTHVTLPYYDVAEGDDTVRRLEAGEEPGAVVDDAVNTSTSERRLQIMFAGGDESVADAADLGVQNCHEILVPPDSWE